MSRRNGSPNRTMLGSSVPARVLAFAMLVFLGLLPQPTVAKEKTTEPRGWELIQKHCLYGRVKVCIISGGVRVTGLDSDISWSCTAPDWDAYLYSEKRKVVCRFPCDSWSKNGIRTALSVASSEEFYRWPRILVSRKKYCGINSRHYSFTGTLKDGASGNKAYGKIAEYITDDQVAAPRQVAAFLQALYDVPIDRAIPLKFSKRVEHSFGFRLKYNNLVEDQVMLDTLRARPTSVVLALKPKELANYKEIPENELIVKKEELDEAFSSLMGERKADKPGEPN